jgi:hypothetical protein
MVIDANALRVVRSILDTAIQMADATASKQPAEPEHDRSADEFCDSCIHRRVGYEAGNPITCHRRAPQRDRDDGSAVWPTVARFDSCGEWESDT